MNSINENDNDEDNNNNNNNDKHFLKNIFNNEINSILNENNHHDHEKDDTLSKDVQSKQRKHNHVFIIANKLKLLGNEKFKLRLFHDATECYENALTTLEGLISDEDENDDDEEDDDEDIDEDVDVNIDEFGQNENTTKTVNINENNQEKNNEKDNKDNEKNNEVCALKVACYLNQARCFLRLWDEDRCLASCAYAEAAAYTESERLKVGPVCCFLKAQLWWQLSGCSGSKLSIEKRQTLSLVPWAKRKQYLCRARDVLARNKSDRSARLLLKSVNTALKNGGVNH
mmetsp:Transcript_1962/g.2469  ORF Transcript_1962/g.2469 Transcript_1962/m.2469 type:complete len:286 (+) Transcript_1962:160-1017(+)